ncbi:chaperone protein dnaJ 20, chloroplastic-like isoform X2 [Andrographis paniculata]|uniref:chaperone protein dnaJ 20, chloroplastic-like isoform X2 n=1 Tax=Andrographis paniculata TaxID=175694 RepID=UPI0021E716C0|nr:chaperone protein dnaJ 20, chloroplastic-like isoform X2 [Andrographis paniculata]
MCSCYAAVAHPLPRTGESLQSPFLASSVLRPPQFVSFQIGPRGSVRASLNETIEEPAVRTFYELLGVPETGTLLEIKQAYKQLARKYHPDVSLPDRVEEHTRRFIRVQEAYETLSDPNRRELYDRDMAKGVHLAFTARRRGKFDEQIADKSEWKSRWQNQVSGLKRRSMQKESVDDNPLSTWGARMRRERNKRL